MLRAVGEKNLMRVSCIGSVSLPYTTGLERYALETGERARKSGCFGSHRLGNEYL
jgi:hypothetical protein